ncbi:MAG: ATP-binding cassette domain-containing protein [Cyclobacteriaceae bacterium]|nr:ATP-binding cassette domain-containing protein [Cyclobacteriaceae bacterium]
MLGVKSITYKVKESTILENVTFEVPKNAICGLLGQNGAGKSTLIKLILGVLEPLSGSISIDGQQLNEFNRIEHLKKIGSLIEQASLYEHLTPLENLELARRIYRVEKGYSEELLSSVGLDEKKKQKVKSLSLGMKQRLGLALAMIGKPELVILDEPTNGLDPDGLNDLKNLIIRFNKEKGATFLISSHHLTELEKVATHVVVLHRGVSTQAIEINRMDSDDLNSIYFKLTKAHYQ